VELKSEIESLLNEIDAEFQPSLSSRMSIRDYAVKVVDKAAVLSIHDQGKLAAFIAIYCNNLQTRIAFMTMLAVAKVQRKRGLAINLVQTSIRYLKGINFVKYKLDVYKTNQEAIALYQKMGFRGAGENEQSLFMELDLQ
jgi:ribosomal protein S18 acetylase RimI-like enzyme